jgi:tetratricopeptide (TPR) repeat protein
MSRGVGLAVFGVVLLVGTGIIAAIILTRGGPAPEPVTPGPRVEAPPEPKTHPEEADTQRAAQEKRRPEYVRLMIAGGTAVNAQRYEEAVRAYSEALTLFPEDADARHGLTEARAALAARSRDKQENDKLQVGFTRFMEQGKEAMTAKEYAAAVRAFQQAIQLMPADADAAKALSEAQTLLAADETQKQKLADYQTHMTAGQAALTAGRYADAVRDYLAALRVMPGDAAALQGQRLAEGRLTAIQDQDKNKAEYTRLLDQAGTALRNQRFAEAVDGYNAALKLFKDDPAAARGLAEAQQGLNNLQAEFARQLALGDAAMRTARYADAILAFRQAVSLNPANALAAKALQDAQVAMANIQNGQAAFLQLMNQGVAALRTRRFADAAQAFTAALQLVPNDPDALQGLRDAQAGLDRGPLDKAEFDRELQRGLADLKKQRFKEAIRHFRHALKLRPEDPQAERGLKQARFGDAMADGRAALTARRFADAVHSFEEALRLVPGDPTATAALRHARTLANQNPKGP